MKHFYTYAEGCITLTVFSSYAFDRFLLIEISLIEGETISIIGNKQKRDTIKQDKSNSF